MKTAPCEREYDAVQNGLTQQRKWPTPFNKAESWRLIIVSAWLAVALSISANPPPQPLISAPILTEGLVLFSSFWRSACIDPKANRLIWSKPRQRVERSPDGTLWLLDPTTGNISPLDARSGEATPACRFTAGLDKPWDMDNFIHDYDGTNLLALSAGMAAEVDLKARSVKWRFACNQIVAHTPDLAIMLTDKFGGDGIHHDPTIIGVNRLDGSIRWTHKALNGTWIRHAVAHGGVLAVTRDHYISCIRLRDGAVAAEYGSPNSVTWAGSVSGKLFCTLVPELKSGLRQGCFELRPPDWRLEPAPALPHTMGDFWESAGDDIILCGSNYRYEGFLTAVRISTGQVLWSKSGRWTVGNVVNGIVYLGGAWEVLEVSVRDGASRVVCREELHKGIIFP